MVEAMISTDYIANCLNRKMTKKVDIIPLTAGKSKMFSIGYLKFLDSFNILAMSINEMANTYGCKTETLYPYKYFNLDSYQEVIEDLKTEDLKSSLSNKLPTQEEVDIFNDENSHKSGRDLSIRY